MNKQQLASKIWSGANNLRGKIPAASYKDYMLGFMFYKYLSEKETKYLKDKLYTDEDIKTILFEPSDKSDPLYEDKSSTYELCNKNLGYFISYDNLFASWIEKGTAFNTQDVTKALSAFDRCVNKDYVKVYGDIFKTLSTGFTSFGSDEGSRSSAVHDLLQIIQEIPMDGSESYDVLGFVYEFLLKNFAANAGKAGEFYTPHEISRIMSEIICDHLKDKKEISIYDPTSGSGSLLINVGQYASRYMSNKNGITYYAQELIPETFNLTRMNLIMRDVLSNNIIIRCGDTLKQDWPFFVDGEAETTYDPTFVDACTSNPPYSQAWEAKDDGDKRFKGYGVAPKSKADYAFLLHNLYHLNNEGIMTIVLPHGVLFRGGDEAKIRKNLIEKDNIETIIGLPANIFYGTGIPTLIMILKKKRASSDVLFIDASKGFIKDGNKNRLRERDIKKIVDTVLRRKTIEGYSRLVGKKEIVEQNDYNLNIPRYVDSSSKDAASDLYACMYGGIPNKEIDLLEEYWSSFPSLRNEIYENLGASPYSKIKTNDISACINKNAEVQGFSKSYSDSLKNLPEFLKDELIEKRHTINIKNEQAIISEKIENAISGYGIVDFYDAYEFFSNDWQSISTDLEVIQIDGDKAFTMIDEIKGYKKDSKNKNKIIEYTERLEGRIFPFAFIQDLYFKNDKDSLERLESDLASNNEEKDSLLESIDPNDKENLINDDGDIVTKKLNAEISKINKEIKKGAEYEEGSYEDTILSISKLNKQISDTKANIKKLKADIDKNTISKIQSLTIDEAKELLYKKWIESLIENLKRLPSKIEKDLENKVKALDKKYSDTLIGIDDEIDEVSNSLISLIDELEADENDKKGLTELKNLLGGDDNE